MTAFEPFPKIPRLRRDCIITEKLDGTNAQVYIRPADEDESGYMAALESGIDTQIEVDGVPAYIRAGSRTRYLHHGGKQDNFGFGMWVFQNAHELAKLGFGRHFGEWYGVGIQRGYELAERRFALFNVHRWNWDPNRPACCGVVPKLGTDTTPFSSDIVDNALNYLRTYGSVAVPGYLKPEGVVVYLPAAKQLFKVLLENDDKPKAKGHQQ